jgi:hypothetical protein
LFFNGDLKGLTALGVKKATAAKASGRWIGGDATSSPLTAFVSFQDLVGSILSPTGHVVAGHDTTVRGTRAYTLIDSDAKSGGTLYVATSGEPLPLQIVNLKRHEKLTFADWSAPLSVTAPPNAITVPSATTAPSAGS